MPAPRPVLLTEVADGERGQLQALAEHAATLAGDPAAAFALTTEHPLLFPLPGRGATATLWQALATLGAVDLTLARALEPHLDAAAILAQAGLDQPASALGQRVRQGTWGVFAAEGAGLRLEATQAHGLTQAHGVTSASAPTASAATPVEGEAVVVLNGTKPWCSLAGLLSDALVTAWVGPDQRRLFAVDLRHAGVQVSDESVWAARGLRAVPSGPVTFTDVPAVPVGAPGWYLDRPGFAWGGIGVAAIWFGGAVGVARRLAEQTRRREPDQIGLAHLGAVDAAVTTGRLALADAARAVDRGGDDAVASSVLALRCRALVARSAEAVLRHVDHALGPAPLALEEEHARRVADLHLYLRQEHAERDQAALGRLLGSETTGLPW